MTMRRKTVLIGAWTVLMLLALTSTAFAADGAEDNFFSFFKYCAIGAGFAIGVAAFGGALGQGRAIAAALEGIARNPNASGKIFTPMIIGLALIESLVIYALIIAFMINGNISPDLLKDIGAALKDLPKM